MRIARHHGTVIGLALLAAMGLWSHAAGRARRIEFADLPRPLQDHFASTGVDERAFPSYRAALEAETDRRVAEGDREHLIYYALQSGRFTDRPRIEPAASARRFVRSLSREERDRLLEDASWVPKRGWPAAERARIGDLLRALGGESTDARLAYFKQMVPAIGSPLAPEALYPDYVRVARFLYQKEFLSGGGAAEVARLYQSRPHSSDTQIDAGFGVYVGLGILRALEPALAVTRVLVIGPGLDLAPRTDLIDAADPQSYQPFAVADALVSLSLAPERTLGVHSVDVNPRVVRAVQAAARGEVTLHLFSGMPETAEHRFSAEYRAYLRQLGRAIGSEASAPRLVTADRRYQHSIAARDSVARAMTAERLNVITERLVDGTGFDVVIATNVLTYFDDRQLALALANIAAMLRPGGYLLHNDARALAEMAGALGMPVVQMRTAVLGGPAVRPVYDMVSLHQKMPQRSVGARAARARGPRFTR